ncbi:DegT/DnrJ/EryC1/StrS family aminotransferase [Sulfuriferula nivalis]|uniref:Aminotransferase DegT n=1 Tax=Sulfuriferula nivalis TaxID=2675298 RepID=A0A809RF23_9PROT|nr:DegT/DnrJ/EryC1/StrS family aminotransferase [Sulfuriferula nivalis]BBO99473.1 aminotransferase DegT [Sulfuriferula nivalis]
MKKRDNYLAFGTPNFTDAEIDAVTRVMRSGWVGMGPETLAFETELADYLGAPEVVTVNSCTSALFLALLAEDIGPGDEVIVPSLTWCATANAVLYLGATPVFCDVDSLTMCVTEASVVAKLTPRTKAVIAVHYGGYAVDVEALRQALPAYVAIIEDAAHALGATYPDGRHVGASGNSVCFSFYANKNLSTADGGAIALFDKDKAERLRSLRMSGMSSNAWSRYTNPSSSVMQGLTELGYKMNYTDLQAAIGRVQLKRMDEMAAARQQVAEHYQYRLAEKGLAIEFQSKVFNAGHARHLLVCRIDQEYTGEHRDALFLKLRAQNIGVSIHYRPLHIQPLYCKDVVITLPNTDYLADCIMTLPISAQMTLDDVDYVVDNLADLIMKCREAI